MFRLIKLLTLSSVCLAFFCFYAYGQTKRALIIAIGKYPEDSGWPEISSGSDDSLIKKALGRQKFSDIRNIADKEATVTGIKNALNSLIERAQPADVVIIHISSHGERLEDMNGNKPDGLEESIVSFDGKQPPYGIEPTKEEVLKLREGYFRDDEFGRYVDKLRSKIGPKGDVVVFMDLCYAGTGTRGTARVRGGRPPLVSPGFYTRQHLLTEDSKQALPLPDEGTMAPYVVIGAARANEADNETTDDNGKPVGPLSYAVSRVFSSLDSNMTYRSFFAKVQAVMIEKLPNQHPVMTGDGQDRKLFAGKFVAQKPYIVIDKINGNHLTLKSGKFAGLDSGARVALYPAGTTDPHGGKLLTAGTVFKAGLYSADVQLDQSTGLKDPALGWVFITSQVFKNGVLKVAIANNVAGLSRGKLTSAYSQNQTERLRSALKNLPDIRLSNNPDVNIAKGNRQFCRLHYRQFYRAVIRYPNKCIERYGRFKGKNKIIRTL